MASSSRAHQWTVRCGFLLKSFSLSVKKNNKKDNSSRIKFWCKTNKSTEAPSKSANLNSRLECARNAQQLFCVFNFWGNILYNAKKENSLLVCSSRKQFVIMRLWLKTFCTHKQTITSHQFVQLIPDFNKLMTCVCKETNRRVDLSFKANLN